MSRDSSPTLSSDMDSLVSDSSGDEFETIPSTPSGNASSVEEEFVTPGAEQGEGTSSHSWSGPHLRGSRPSLGRRRRDDHFQMPPFGQPVVPLRQ